MQVWIFSDLHLTDSSSPLYRALLKTLKDPKSTEDVVVFSGDIFDLLVGDSPYFRKKFSELFEAIDRLASLRVRLHYIEGNHDFHLKKLFPRVMNFHDESVVLTDPNTRQKIYIAHGDLVDPNDSTYLRFREVLRAKPVKILSKVLPGKWIEKIGAGISRPLVQKEAELPENWLPEDRERLRAIFRGFAKSKHEQGIDFVVLGHCHDLDEVDPYYFNMGYPPVHRKYVLYSPSADPEKSTLKRVSF